LVSNGAGGTISDVGRPTRIAAAIHPGDSGNHNGDRLVNPVVVKGCVDIIPILRETQGARRGFEPNAAVKERGAAAKVIQGFQNKIVGILRIDVVVASEVPKRSGKTTAVVVLVERCIYECREIDRIYKVSTVCNTARFVNVFSDN
jgi:hypothetical protein